MFLTQMGMGGYDSALASLGNIEPDQSTSLLQKRKQLQQVEAEYVRKRREYDERMKQCQEREAELAAKQEVIRVNVVRFERFISDNDTKRQRALTKERDEIAERLTLQQELEGLERVEQRSHAGLAELTHSLGYLAKYEAFLDGVVEDSLKFSEIPEVLFKYGTLQGTNVDLRGLLEARNLSVEADRARLYHYTKDKEDEVMVGGAYTSRMKMALEAIRVTNAKAEEVIEHAAKVLAEKVMELGATKSAIANLFQRCKAVSRGTPTYTMAEPDLVLEFIQNKVTDLEFAIEVGCKGPEAAGLKLGKFNKHKHRVDFTGTNGSRRAAGGGARASIGAGNAGGVATDTENVRGTP